MPNVPVHYRKPTNSSPQFTIRQVLAMASFIAVFAGLVRYLAERHEVPIDVAFTGMVWAVPSACVLLILVTIARFQSIASGGELIKVIALPSRAFYFRLLNFFVTIAALALMMSSTFSSIKRDPSTVFYFGFFGIGFAFGCSCFVLYSALTQVEIRANGICVGASFYRLRSWEESILVHGVGEFPHSMFEQTKTTNNSIHDPKEG